MSPFEAAVQYHVECEEYDRRVCSGTMGRDGILPANYREFANINNHALWVRSNMAKKARMLVTDFDVLIRDKRVHDEADRIIKNQPTKPQPIRRGK